MPNLMARSDDRKRLLFPEGFGVGALAAAARHPVTGVWRSHGTIPGKPGTAAMLFLEERQGQVVGRDTDSHGRLVGVIKVDRQGRKVISGQFVRSDGRKGVFDWLFASGGQHFSGVWRTAGAQGGWGGIQQGAGLTPQLRGFLGQRDAATADLSGFNYETLKVGGITIGSVPPGYSQDPPGGGKVEIGRKGVKVEPPDPKKILESAGGDTPRTPEDTTTTERSSKVLKVAIGVAAVAAVLGVVAFLRGRKRSGQA